MVNDALTEDFSRAAGRYKPQIAEPAPEGNPAQLIHETLALEREIVTGLEKLPPILPTVLAESIVALLGYFRHRLNICQTLSGILVSNRLVHCQNILEFRTLRTVKQSLTVHVGRGPVAAPPPLRAIPPSWVKTLITCQCVVCLQGRRSHEEN